MEKVILVTGSTGRQGFSVAKHLLESKRYSVRCFVRDTCKETCKQLKQMGAEICEGRFENPETIEKAMHGCYGCFINTNFWER
jgi:uncharacterized protein YbjT (DUF2867 family)